MRTKTAVIVVFVALTVVAIGAAGSWLFWLREPTAPDPVRQRPEEIVKYLASDDYSRMPEASRRDYFEKVRQLRAEHGGDFLPIDRLTENELESFGRNVRPFSRQRGEDRIEKYFSLPPEQRVAYLDQAIDRMQARMAQRRTQPSRQGSAASGGRGGRRGGFMTPARLRNRIEKTEPIKRAKSVEFRKAMRKRMKERGITFPRPP